MMNRQFMQGEMVRGDVEGEVQGRDVQGNDEDEADEEEIAEEREVVHVLSPSIREEEVGLLNVRRE